MPRVRFTLRWMLVMVAIMGMLAAIGAQEWRIRTARARYSSMAATNMSLFMNYMRDTVNASSGVELEFRLMIQELTRELDALEKLPSALTAAEDDAIRRKKAAVRKRIDEAEKAVRAGHSRARVLGRKANYHAELSKKYTQAARRPWLPVEPDPPEPE